MSGTSFGTEPAGPSSGGKVVFGRLGGTRHSHFRSGNRRGTVLAENAEDRVLVVNLKRVGRPARGCLLARSVKP